MNNFKQIFVSPLESKCDHLYYAKINGHFEGFISLISQQQLTHLMAPFSKDCLHLATMNSLLDDLIPLPGCWHTLLFSL